MLVELARNGAWAVPLVSVNDIEIYYESHGSGDPLMMLGGLGLTVSEMRPLLEALAVGGLRVIAVDNRGTGRTSAPPGPYSIEQMAGDTAALLDRLEIPHAHVLGISMGGRIALTLALQRPELVDRLVLVSTGARVRGRRRLVVLGMVLARLPVLRGKNPQPAHAMKAQFSASSRFDYTDRLGEIKQPVLIMHGGADHMAPLELAEEMHHRIAGSRLVVLDGGHLIALTPRRRDMVCSTIQRFLASG
jgi:3-oxoadipate enol-lactonase